MICFLKLDCKPQPPSGRYGGEIHPKVLKGNNQWMVITHLAQNLRKMYALLKFGVSPINRQRGCIDSTLFKSLITR
jgi:hypothetical protein